jgi:primosomal protein N' (replication factor Y) (superfamily II helicase)
MPGDYPPYFYTVLVSVSAKNEQNAAREALKSNGNCRGNLRAPDYYLRAGSGTISRLKSQYYYQILVKYKREKHLNELLHPDPGPGPGSEKSTA